MRKTIFALVTSALIAGAVFVGCGGDDAVNVGDMATKSGSDGMVTGGDAAKAKLGCGSLLGCYSDCAQSATTDAEYTTCQANCDKLAKSGSLQKYQNALACGQSHC